MPFVVNEVGDPNLDEDLVILIRLVRLLKSWTSCPQVFNFVQDVTVVQNKVSLVRNSQNVS